MLATSMHTVVTGEGEIQGTSPFYWLSGCENGRTIIMTHWDELKAHPMLATSMHTVVTGKGGNQGASPFYWFAGTEEGREFLLEHWDDFKGHPMLATSMHTVLTGEGDDQGASPFYWFTTSEEGRKFLISRWEDFFTLLRPPASLMDRIITIDGPFKGQTYSQLIQDLERYRRRVEGDHAMETRVKSPQLGEIPAVGSGFGMFDRRDAILADSRAFGGSFKMIE
jgi:hypothetical protein